MLACVSGPYSTSTAVQTAGKGDGGLRSSARCRELRTGLRLAVQVGAGGYSYNDHGVTHSFFNLPTTKGKLNPVQDTRMAATKSRYSASRPGAENARGPRPFEKVKKVPSHDSSNDQHVAAHLNHSARRASAWQAERRSPAPLVHAQSPSSASPPRAQTGGGKVPVILPVTPGKVSAVKEVTDVDTPVAQDALEFCGGNIHQASDYLIRARQAAEGIEGTVETPDFEKVDPSSTEAASVKSQVIGFARAGGASKSRCAPSSSNVNSGEGGKGAACSSGDAGSDTPRGDGSSTVGRGHGRGQGNRGRGGRRGDRGGPRHGHGAAG